jgi:hypothetical protein
MAVAVDSKDLVYVADLSTVTVFSRDGEYLRAFRHGLPDANVEGLAVASNGAVYLACFAVFGQKVVHEYSSDGQLIRSFADSYATGRDVEPNIEEYFAGGDVAIDRQENVIFSQRTPYEIRRFTSDGALKLVITRNNNFLYEVSAERRACGALFLPWFPHSERVFVRPDGTILNVVVSRSEVAKTETTFRVMDLFTADGRLEASATIDGGIVPLCLDARGKVCARIEVDGRPAFGRYVIRVEN